MTRGRLRLVVKARKALPKAFIWEILLADEKGGNSVKLTSEPHCWPTMEAAYVAGTQVLAQYKS
jgi:hypothetical protein